MYNIKNIVLWSWAQSLIANCKLPACVNKAQPSTGLCCMSVARNHLRLLFLGICKVF